VGAVWRFRGIPYAAAPTGELRWRPPAAPPPWSGVREAKAFGRSCPQVGKLVDGETLETDEDCLTLNVWSPGLDGKRRPVMVWLHGGGLVNGGAAQPVYEGAQLAGAGVVLVSLNYRLGPLGYLAHPSLSAEDAAHHASGNYGLYDQLAALGWVQKAIARFGGDPKRVTVFGESAGSMSVCALLASPLARGKLHRAILESGACVSGKRAPPLRGEGSAEAQGERLARALGCDGAGAAACLRGKSAGEVLAALPSAIGLLGKGERWSLAVDGWALPRAPGDALDAGELADVPALVGSNGDEATIFTAQAPIDGPLSYRVLAGAILGDAAGRALELYPIARYRSPRAAADALLTDLAFTCPAGDQARGLAKRQRKVFRYRFTHVTDGARARGIGACHGCELRFVFGTLADGASDAERELSRAMVGYWTRFAATGDPNGAGATRWKAYPESSDGWLQLDAPIAAAADPSGEACRLFAGVAARPQN
jgi:para-nitrobenzyl esterase